MKNIRKTNETCKIHSNGGVLTTNKKATVPRYGEVWYHPRALSNVISVNEATDRDMFITWGKNKTMHFGPDQNNTVEFSAAKYKVFVYEPKANQNKFLIDDYLLNFTLEDRLAKFTPRQREGIDKAQRFYKLVGSPGRENFYKMIARNHIKNCPISLDDAKNMFRAIIQEVAVIKGKTVRRNQAHIASNQKLPVEPYILAAHKEVTLCIDIFFVDSLHPKHIQK